MLSLAEAAAYAMRARGGRGRPSAGWTSLTPTEIAVRVHAGVLVLPAQPLRGDYPRPLSQWTATNVLRNRTLRGGSGSGNPCGLVDASASGANMQAGSEREIVFPPRAFGDVHQLVFLFQSWQVLLESDLPPALQPLKEIPEDLEPVVAMLLRDARTQLENAQQDVEISLRFPATPELISLLHWAAVQLREIAGLTDDSDLDPAWVGALALAKDFVDAALTQLAVKPLA